MKIFSKVYLVSIFFSLNVMAAGLTAPNISANALLLYKNSNLGNSLPGNSNPATAYNVIDQNGLDIEEAELNFYADVDPYSHLNMVLTIHPNYVYNSTTKKVEQSWILEPEELFAESSEIPYTTFKIGKFKAAIGKQAILHTHAFPLIVTPLTNHVILGDDGLLDVGVSGAFLIPLPWFSELTVQGMRGKADNTEFNSPYPNNPVGVGHFKNLFDLTSTTTMELGQSYAYGKNSVNQITAIRGLDATFKWRPESSGKYNSLLIGGEYLDRTLGQGLGYLKEKSNGYYIWTKWQFAERWDVVLRTDKLKVANSDSNINVDALVNGTSYKNYVGFDFNASEFSSLHLEYNWMKGTMANSGLKNEKTVFLQANFTIGSHPAHGY